MGSTDWLAALGARPAGARAARIARSPNVRDGIFQNPIATRKTLPGTLWQSLRLQLLGREQRVPPAPLPIRPLTRVDVAAPPASGLRATWLGHATALLDVDGARVLLDPVWAERASPSALVGPRRFHPPPLALAELPPLDAVIISHDHYDHLDMAAVRALDADPAQARARFVVPLGVGAHLERWGVAAERITELDWGESTTVGALIVTATPARHFSGRGVGDAVGRGNATLWASWVIAGPIHRVFFSGDTGPFDGLADIGAQYGPFDLTLIKMGAYGPTWPDIHLTPEQAVAAHGMLRGRVLLPIHWGTFNLAFHAWDEPAKRVLAAARAAGATLVLPRPGEPVEPATPPPVDAWWRAVRAPILPRDAAVPSSRSSTRGTMQLDEPHQMIESLYAAFNARDLDAVLAAMHPEVDWPNGWEGGRVHGPNAVREYWTRQWAAIDPRVDPVGVTVSASGTVDVDVHQTVRDLTGRLLDDQRVRHAYRFEDGLVRRMDIHEADAAGASATE